MSKDPASVSAFYERIFGWKIQHMPEMNYRLVETGGVGGINGGILKPEREGPWPGNMLLYIDVDDLADYRKKIVAAGRQNPRRGAGGARHGRVLALHGSRGPHDGAVEGKIMTAVRGALRVPSD
jgi:hypothetical protein